MHGPSATLLRADSRTRLHNVCEKSRVESQRDGWADIGVLLGFDSPSSILDTPCGHGRISNLLAGAGYEITGVDNSKLLLKRARIDTSELGVAVDYRLGDVRQLPVDGPFSAVVGWFASFGYFNDHDNRAALAEFSLVLGPGGCRVLYLLDVSCPVTT